MLLTLTDLCKRYPTGNHAIVDHLNLEIPAGELVTLLGPSGCGKTTTLRMIAGFERPDDGCIQLEDRILNDTKSYIPPEKRNIGMVFQDYALFPHLTVLGNVLFGLHHLPKAQRLAQAHEILDLTGLHIFSQRYPHQLSGGQQQRVALARALAPRPRLLLMDEPFSNLDAALRHTTRAEVRKILHEAGMTALLVTHDQEEALSFSDRVVVMRAGVIEQVGSPSEVYQSPKTAFVARFLGRSNIIQGLAQGNQAQTAIGVVALSAPHQGAVLLSIRPEDLALSDAQHGHLARIISREYKGHHSSYTVHIGDQELLWHDYQVHTTIWQEGDEVYLQLKNQAHVVH